MADLQQKIQKGLAKHKGKWPQIARETDTGYDWLAKIGRGKYSAAPAYQRLVRVEKWLDRQSARKQAA